MKRPSLFAPFRDSKRRPRVIIWSLVVHTPGFDLTPATHKTAEWFPKGHSEAAAESLKEFGEATAEAKDLIDEGIPARLTTPVEHCSTCHTKAFCADCHTRLGLSLKSRAG